MSGIKEIVDWVNANRTLVFNLAYRLTGEAEGAVELISQAAAVLAKEQVVPDHICQRLLSQICQEYSKVHGKNNIKLAPKDAPVEAILSQLPPQEKIALVLHDVLRLSRRDVIRISGEPEIVFRMRLNRARNLIKNQLIG